MHTPTDIDKTAIDRIIKQFFGIFNNKSHSIQDWNLTAQICIPESIFVKKEGLQQMVYSLANLLNREN